MTTTRQCSYFDKSKRQRQHDARTSVRANDTTPILRQRQFIPKPVSRVGHSNSHPFLEKDTFIGSIFINYKVVTTNLFQLSFPCSVFIYFDASRHLQRDRESHRSAFDAGQRIGAPAFLV